MYTDDELKEEMNKKTVTKKDIDKHTLRFHEHGDLKKLTLDHDKHRDLKHYHEIDEGY